MEFIGIIKEVGQAKKVNDTWYRDIVLSQLNYDNGYENNVVFTIKNEKISHNGQRDYLLKNLYESKLLVQGSVLKVLFNLSASQSKDGQWFNHCTAWAINTLDYGRKQTASVQQVTVQPQSRSTYSSPQDTDAPF